MLSTHAHSHTCSIVSYLPCSGMNSVLFQHIYEDDNMTLGIFAFPAAGTCIPLHDHPGMTVISR